jgi:predicted transcriptional regulator
MKDSAIKILDDKNLEFAHILRRIGVQQNVATFITFLMNVDKATAREIEIGSDLRQPEICTASRVLRKNGWLEEDDIKRGGKGRPFKVYKLKATISEIIKYFEEEKIRESTQILKDIQKLKELTSS